MNASSANPNHDSRIQGFDGLRAIAFLMVFVSHKSLLAHKDSYGDAGVYLFFVLSGFLITRILAQSREAMARPDGSFRAALAKFYLRRTARIFPVYYLLLAMLALGLVVTSSGLRPVEWLSYWTYTTNIYVGRTQSWDLHAGHLWTLAIEEQFYLLFAPVALLLPRRWTWVASAAFLILGVATKIAMERAGATIIAMDVNSFVNFTLLALGGLIGLGADRPSPPWFASGLAQAVTLGGFILAPVLWGGSLAWLHDAKIVGLGAAMLLYQIYQGQRTWFVRALEVAPLRVVGRVSYGAYLFHNVLHFPIVAETAERLGGSELIANIARMGAELAATLALTAVSWILLERPVIAWAKRAST